MTDHDRAALADALTAIVKRNALAHDNADIHDRVCAEWAEASQNNYQIAKGAVAERDALAAALTTMGVDPASIIAAMAKP